nr:ribonuclease domain-containing protein [Butyrivibrio sp.]
MRKVKFNNRIRLITLMVMMLTAMLLAGCGKKPVQLVQPGSAGDAAAGSISATEASAEASTADLATFVQSTESGSGDDATASESSSVGTDEASSESSSVGTDEVASESTSAESDEATDVTTVYAAHTEPLLDEEGTYTSKVDVAMYIHTYGKLPSNFMTKKQAKKLGWSGGSLEEYAPGMCIGGDYFGNYEGLLPEDKEYHECDIDTLGKKSRGAKRIIYSDDGYIYYTEDHYESFEQLYGE